MSTTLIRVARVEVLGEHRVRLSLTNGEKRVVDLSPYLHGPLFEAIRRDPREFARIRVDPELGTVVWPNGADICPDVLVHGRTVA